MQRYEDNICSLVSSMSLSLPASSTGTDAIAQVITTAFCCLCAETGGTKLRLLLVLLIWTNYLLHCDPSSHSYALLCLWTCTHLSATEVFCTGFKAFLQIVVKSILILQISVTTGLGHDPPCEISF